MSKNSQNIKLFIFISLILHILVIFLVLFKYSPKLKNTDKDEELLIFEMMPVSDISNVANLTKKNNTQKLEDAKKVMKPKEELVETNNNEKNQEVQKVEKKEKIKDPEPINNKDAEPIKATKLEKEVKKDLDKKDNVKKTDSKNIKNSKDDKKDNKITKENNKKKKILQDAELDSLLKTLEKASSGDNMKSKNKSQQNESKTANMESKGNFDPKLSLSVNEIAIIKQQIQRQWNQPIGANDLNRIKITLHIVFNIDGSVVDVDIIDKSCGGTTAEVCNIAADSAQRAVWAASPLQNLSQDRYEVWKEFNFLFVPGG